MRSLRIYLEFTGHTLGVGSLLYNNIALVKVKFCFCLGIWYSILKGVAIFSVLVNVSFAMILDCYKSIRQYY